MADSKGLTKAENTKPKRKRNRPDLVNFGAEFVEPGDNSRYLRLARVPFQLPPIDISDPEQVAGRIEEYFDFCEQQDLKPNIKGLGNWIGVSDETVRLWRNGIYRNDSHFGVIKKAVDTIQELWWQYGQDGKVNPASWIFIGKNAFGMKDTQDYVITPGNNMADQNASEIAQKYNELPE